MVRASLLGIVLLIATSAARVDAREPVVSVAEVLAGTVFSFDGAQPALVLPAAEEAFGLDAEMQAFVAPLSSVRDPSSRLTALLSSMAERGLFSLEYAEVTRSASRTFADRQGNCLSFTMLFVSLARAAGLNAVYQNVEVPPSWAMDGRVVIAQHVNSLVKTGFDEETIVDFNIRDYDARQKTRRITDEATLGLFYTNLGAEALIRGEHARSFQFLRAAVATDADSPGVWINLGVLYAREQLFEHAEAAYVRALEIAPDEPSAMANLALVYASLGEAQLAEEMNERVQSYRERNPYYHYSLAQAAYQEQRFVDALAALRRALRLKYDEPEFYALRGGVFANLGRIRDAHKDYDRAREYAAEEDRRNSERVRFDPLALR